MMKKLIALLSLVSLVFGPGSALATNTSATVGATTTLTQDSGSGSAPIVKAKFETLRNSPLDDDTTLAGAQLNPSGQYKTDKQFRMCGVVTDPDGVADISNVYGDIWYPEETYLGPKHETGRQGCGQMVQTECQMTKLTKQQGYETFCGVYQNNGTTDNSVQTKNPNVTKFNTVGGTTNLYTYNEICKSDGELMKETAYVYCCDRTLSYEDPSGDYEAIVYAQDNSGKSSYLLNNFTYTPTTAFETDFTSVSYGNVKLNTEKIINGDIPWTNDTPAGPLASVRNTGNTRLNVTVNQDDMGLGMTGSTYNVWYKARVGNNSVDWTTYVPNVTTTLAKSMDLSETNEMDFAVNITKFPPLANGSFGGHMTLGAVSAPHLTCEAYPNLDVSPR